MPKKSKMDRVSEYFAELDRVMPQLHSGPVVHGMTTHENEVILQTTIDIVCEGLEVELADMVGDPAYTGWLGIIAVAAVALGADTTYVARWIGLDANVLQDLSDRTWADSVARKGAFALVATVTHWLQTFSEEEGL